jgi:Peptidase family M23
MFPNRSIPLMIVASIHYVIPLALILWLWAGKSRSKFSWAVKTLFVATYLILIYFIGFWGFASFYLRYSWFLVFVFAGIFSYLKVRGLPFYAKVHARNWIWTALESGLSIFFIYLITGAIGANIYDTKPVELSFPFKNGVYSPYWGGNGKASSFMNYHYLSSIHKGAKTNLSMKYAVDIEKLNSLGMSSKGFLPLELENYEIYQQKILSPCDGKVIEVVDGLRNEMPWSGNYPYNVGNHVAIIKGDVCVVLGHMQPGSIPVKVGDSVRTGEVIGKVGSSGMADQPHIHIQAMKVSEGSIWAWEGVPIIFDWKNPVKNSLFFK